MSDIHPAATAVLVRDRQQQLEVLMVRRSSELSFGAGKWVFPGGRIDSEDFEGDMSDLPRAAHRAAIREVREETGVDIRHVELVHFAHWTTPSQMSKRFSTWFFIGRLQEETEVEVDNGEIHEHRWWPPEAVLRAHGTAEITLMVPTFVSLTQLACAASSVDAVEAFRHRGAFTYEPFALQSEEGKDILFQGDAGYDNREISPAGPLHRIAIRSGKWRYINELPQT